jgi:dihydroorotate dehydrogenase
MEITVFVDTDHVHDQATRKLITGIIILVASALLTQGVGVLERIESELLEIMVRKDYKSINNFRGKLKDGSDDMSC